MFGDDTGLYTTQEYKDLSLWKKIVYIFYHYPLFLIFVWPFLNFLFFYRIPFWSMLNKSDKKSIWWNNLMLVSSLFVLYHFVGLDFLLYVFLPIFYLSSVIGPWLFMIQHNYEDTYWERSKKWSLQDASLKGSSFYLLPAWLHYLTGNIWYHHVHHLLPSVASYHLPSCYKRYGIFHIQGLKISESFHVPNLCLWDE